MCTQDPRPHFENFHSVHEREQSSTSLEENPSSSALMLETTFENCVLEYPLPELKAQLEFDPDPLPEFMQLKL